MDTRDPQAEQPDAPQPHGSVLLDDIRIRVRRCPKSSGVEQRSVKALSKIGATNAGIVCSRYRAELWGFIRCDDSDAPFRLGFLLGSRDVFEAETTGLAGVAKDTPYTRCRKRRPRPEPDSGRRRKTKKFQLDVEKPMDQRPDGVRDAVLIFRSFGLTARARGTRPPSSPEPHDGLAIPAPAAT